MSADASTLPTSVLAGVAQLVEHLFCKQAVRGSSPLPSSKSKQSSITIETTLFGGLPEWPMGAGCKPAGVSLRWFESNTLHNTRKPNSLRQARLSEDSTQIQS